ncbi:MAG: DUF3782 domain-containing protein [Candidatus Bathyarchaeia archaeon]
MAKTLSLKEEFLNLLEKDKEFRYAVAGLLGLEEILKRLDKHEEELVKLRKELVKLGEEQVKLREEQIKLGEEQVKLREEQKRLAEEQVRLREDMITGFKRHDEELAKLREDMITGFKRHDEEIAKLREDMNLLREDMNKGFMLVERHISALGARWGLISEEAFREGIKQLVEKEFGFKVEKWIKFDEKGIVFGYPSQIDIDIAIHDKKIVLVEIKSHVRPSDVAAFKRKAELYSQIEGKKPSRLLIITPYAEEKAFETAKNLEIEIYTKI